MLNTYTAWKIPGAILRALRLFKETLELVRECINGEKYSLPSAMVLGIYLRWCKEKGKHATGYGAARDDLVNAGAEQIEKPMIIWMVKPSREEFKMIYPSFAKG